MDSIVFSEREFEPARITVSDSLRASLQIQPKNTQTAGGVVIFRGQEMVVVAVGGFRA
jgi:hypothetical protein